MYFSLIIPVFNRPDEMKELLESLTALDYVDSFEIVVVEDGSTITSENVITDFSDKLQISYYIKNNTGPGDSRNYGMKKAKGDYFIIFDSDCIIPAHYLQSVSEQLESDYVDCFGGPDQAHESFSDIQKAINFSMTSFLTTGGIRGGSEKVDKFQPRSFNMGISKLAFESTGGFGNIHPGEDPDLSIRLWKMKFRTRLFPNSFVYHKRRIDWDKFSKQVSKFGKARPILNHWHPEFVKAAYFLPAVFVLGFYFAMIMAISGNPEMLIIYGFYFLAVLASATLSTKKLKIGFLSVIAVWKQFFGYGNGFILSYFKIQVLKQKPEAAFPDLFFNS